MALATSQDYSALDDFNKLARSRDWSARCYEGSNFEHKELNALSDLWRIMATNGIPSRALFDMRTLKPYLQHISIVERVKDGSQIRFKFRLIGSEIARIFGESTGRFLDETVPTERLENWTATLETAFAHGGPVRFVSYFQIPQISYLVGESFAAPLSSESNSSTTILSATYVGEKRDSKVDWSTVT